MRLKFQIATPGDIPDLVVLRVAASQRLAEQFGEGYWSGPVTARSILFAMRNSTVYAARDRNGLIATFTLSTRKPWAIDRQYFSRSKRPLYLTAMAVAPGVQRRGVGRLALDEARRIAMDRESDAIRLDAWDAPAGAGDFYRKCGFGEVGRASYRNTRLIYFEMLL